MNGQNTFGQAMLCSVKAETKADISYGKRKKDGAEEKRQNNMKCWKCWQNC